MSGFDHRFVSLAARHAFGDASQAHKNVTDIIPYSDVSGIPNWTEYRYWPKFGTLQYFELAYIFSVILLGTFGNLVVIFSIVLEKKVHSSGNIFIINLAIADFLICAVTLPSMAANIIVSGNALNQLFCKIVGYIVTATAVCSLCNLALVALNRYCAVVKYAWYRKHFTKPVGIGLACLSWVWSVLIVSPTVLGWSSLTFDGKSLVCAWLDTASFSYSIFLITVAVVIPLGFIAFSYYKIFSTVRASGRWKRNLSVSVHRRSDRHRRLLKRERTLLFTLLATIIAFCICWAPYAVHVLIDPGNTAAHLKKFFVWLAFTNSCLNFIIYGTLNPAFKKGYRRLFFFVFRCIKEKRSPGRLRTQWSSGHTADRSVYPVNGSKTDQHRNGGISRYSLCREVGRSSWKNFDQFVTKEARPTIPLKSFIPHQSEAALNLESVRQRKHRE